MELRPYQTESVQKINEAWDSGKKKLLLSLPTGCGKTIVFSEIAREQAEKNNRVLIFAHREELIEQAADKLYKVTGIRSALEKDESSCIGSKLPVVISTVQTMRSRLSKFPADYFQTIIVDEAHHSLAKSYKRVLDHFPDAKVLGVTATPGRGDKKKLDDYFELVYDYELRTAIKDGWLCPIKTQTVPFHLDLRSVRITAGDYAASDLGQVVYAYMYGIIDQMKTYCRGRKTLVFLPLVETSQRFCKMLNEKGFRAAEVNGESKDRKEVISGFANGEYDVLCNAMLLTEGWDCPSVDCIIILRPTRSPVLYQQMIGRGTRLAEGKSDLLLLDFLWQTKRPGLLRPCWLLNKDANVRAHMEKLVDESNDVVDLFAAEEQAERDIVAEREAAILRERLENERREQERKEAEERRKYLEEMEAKALALARERNEKRKAREQAEAERYKDYIDPRAYATWVNDIVLTNYDEGSIWEYREMSPKQKNILEQEHINPIGVSAGYASRLITCIFDRSQSKMSTPRQLAYLVGLGFTQAGTWNRMAAQTVINRIMDNGGVVPQYMYPTEHYDPRREQNRHNRVYPAQAQPAPPYTAYPAAAKGLQRPAQMVPRDPNLASLKQINKLREFGFPDPSGWTKADAHKMISKIANNGWKVPPDINPATYRVEVEHEKQN